MNVASVFLSPVEWFKRPDRGDWVEGERLLLCASPDSKTALKLLASERRISVLLNVRESTHDPKRLAAYNLCEVHLPVPDKSAPTPPQIEAGVAAIVRLLESGHRLAIHCRSGKGRSGVLAACYLVGVKGLTADEAIARVRAARKGAIETDEQAAAIAAYARAANIASTASKMRRT